MTLHRSLAALLLVAVLLAGGCSGGSGGGGTPPVAGGGEVVRRLTPPPPPPAPDSSQARTRAEASVASAQSLSLAAGWNLVAFPVGQLTSVTPGEGLDPTLFAWSPEGGAYEAVPPTVSGLNAGSGTARGFWAFANAPTTLGYEGTGAPPSVSLQPGWNLVGFPSGTAGDHAVGAESLPSAVCAEVPAPAGCELHRFAFLFGSDGAYEAADLGVPETALARGRGAWVFAHVAATLQTAVVLESLRVEPASPALTSGQEVALKALGSYSDGSERDLTDSVEWSSSSVVTATVSNLPGSRGRAVGLLPGQAVVTASEAGTGLSADVTVPVTAGPAPVTQITLLSVGMGGVPADGHNGIPWASVTGHKVAFPSQAHNLVPGPAGSFFDIDWWTAGSPPTLTRASEDAEGNPANAFTSWPAMAPDGLSLSFESSATNLTPEASAVRSIYVRDLPSGKITMASVSSTGAPANDGCNTSAISGDGRFVAFTSRATNLVPDDTNGVDDVFVRDRLLGTTERVSVSSTGVPANGMSWDPAITPDGRYVAFVSAASNLVAGDTNGRYDAFRFDRVTRTMVRVSVGAAEGSGAGDVQLSITQSVPLSGDGNQLVFARAFSTAPFYRLFVHDVAAGTSTLVAGFTNAPPGSLALSLDGRHLGFAAQSRDVLAVTSSSWQAFARDLQSGDVALVSRTPGGGIPNGEVNYCRLSGDGRTMAISSFASDLVAGDTNAFLDVFLAPNPLAP